MLKSVRYILHSLQFIELFIRRECCSNPVLRWRVASWVRSLHIELMFLRWYSIQLLTQFICLFMLSVESKYTPRLFASLLTATRWDPISSFRSFTWDTRWGFVITRNSVLSSLISSLLVIIHVQTSLMAVRSFSNIVESFWGPYIGRAAYRRHRCDIRFYDVEVWHPVELCTLWT